MNREQAINYLRSSGMSDEQIETVAEAFREPGYVSTHEIANAPSVRPQEPKTGHWIYKKRMIGTGGKYYTGEDENGETHTIHVFERSCCDVGYCSECGKRQGDTSDRYCCYCGSYNGDDKQLREQEPCDKCEVGNPCLYCKHEFEPQESEEG